MKDYKETGKHSWIIVLCIIVGLGIGIWSSLVPNEVNEEAVKETFQKDKHYQYFYEQLNSTQKQTYQRMLYVFSNQLESIVLKETKIENIRNIMSYVLYDHPELFYVNNQFEYVEEYQCVEFYPKYDYSKEEVLSFNNQIHNKIQPVIKKAKQYKTKSLQARYLYEYIIENVEYKENRKIDQNIISSLLENKSVCAGYARAYQYLLSEVGINGVYIVGTAKTDNSQTIKGDGHAWVMVEVDHDYYYCDPTWGDVVENNMQHTCYGYFMMTSQEMSKLYNSDVPCQKTKKNKHYYYEENDCFVEKYNEKQLMRLVKESNKKGNHVAEIKCGNAKVYQEIKNKIEHSYLGYRLLSENGCWSDNATYACYDDLKLIELYY